MKIVIFSFGFLSILCLTGPAFPLDIPLTVAEPTGVSRSGEPVTSGVPLPSGMQTTTWALFDGAAQIPVQITNLPGRTPWILLDFQTDVASSAQKTLTLRDVPSTASPANPVTVVEDTAQITVTTGPLKVLIRKNPFNMFDAVWLDRNSDGTYAGGEQVVSASGDNLQVLDNTTGNTYIGTMVPDSMTWDYQGPMRATLKITGKYKNGSTELMAYTTRITFYAGKASIKIDHLLRNSFQANKRHLKIRSATIKIGSGTTSVRATYPGSTSWVNVGSGGATFELVPANLWGIDTTANSGMVVPDLSYHGASLVADFSESLSSVEKTNRTSAAKVPLFARAAATWYSEYGELSTTKFSTLDDERKSYQLWGWAWTTNKEPQDPLATGPNKSIPDYTISWRNVIVHGDTESDDLWQHSLMYFRTGQQSYWDRSLAWARFMKWEYTFRTDGFSYAGDSGYEQSGARVTRANITIPLTSADNTYLSETEDGRVDVQEWGGCHFWGWGLIDYYYLTGDRDALEAAQDLGEISERILGWRTPGSYSVGNLGGPRQEARQFLFATRLYEATQLTRWQNLMNHIAQLFIQSPDWDTARGSYLWDTAGHPKAVSTVHFGFTDHAFDRYYKITGNTTVRDRLVAMAYFVKNFGLPLAPLGSEARTYTGNIIFDSPNPGDWFHSSRNDPAYTITLIDTLVRGYRLTGDLTLLSRAKLHWNLGSKQECCDLTVAPVPDNQVGKFMNNWFLYDGIRKYYSVNKGDLSYAHLLFYDYANLNADSVPPAPPTGMRIQ